MPKVRPHTVSQIDLLTQSPLIISPYSSIYLPLPQVKNPRRNSPLHVSPVPKAPRMPPTTMPCLRLQNPGWMQMWVLGVGLRVWRKVNTNLNFSLGFIWISLSFASSYFCHKSVLSFEVSGFLSFFFSLFLTQLACQKRPSGHLVSVLNGAEASFVSSLVKSTVNSYQYIWIGLHDPTLVRFHSHFIVTP
jgi:hypothetical protein